MSPSQRHDLVVAILEEAVELLSQIEDDGLEPHEAVVSTLGKRLSDAVDYEDGGVNNASNL